MTLHQRFYVALALNELVQEVPLSEVAVKFGLQKGLLQNLQQSAATFAGKFTATTTTIVLSGCSNALAETQLTEPNRVFVVLGMVAIFCKRLGWHNLELLISQFQKRLHFGVQQELCDLLQLVPMTAQVCVTSRKISHLGTVCVRVWVCGTSLIAYRSRSPGSCLTRVLRRCRKWPAPSFMTSKRLSEMRGPIKQRAKPHLFCHTFAPRGLIVACIPGPRSLCEKKSRSMFVRE